MARRRRPVRRGQRQPGVQRRDRRERRAQRARLADPRRAQRPGRRPPAAVPAVLHAAVRRPDGVHRGKPAVRRPAAVRRRELRLPGGAHLLRRDAQDGQLPGDAGTAVRDRRRDRLLRDDLRRAPDLRSSTCRCRPCSSSRPSLYGLFAIPIFLVVREPRRPATPRSRPCATSLAALTQLATTIRHAREVPGLGRFLLGRFFYSDAVNTIIVVMAIVATEAMGLSDSRQPRSCCRWPSWRSSRASAGARWSTGSARSGR